MYLAADGGGSKLEIILFDDEMNLLGHGRGGSINFNVVSREQILRSIEDALDQAIDGRAGLVLEHVYLSFIGDTAPFFTLLEKRAVVRDRTVLSELQAGIMAGAMWRTGIIAISGTGSNLILETGGIPFRPLRGGLPKVGGWGAVLGDDGSGAWIGRMAAQAAIEAFEGWGEPSCLMEEIQRQKQLDSPYALKRLVYFSPAPYGVLASLTYAVASAANRNDVMALRILEEAGRRLAEQAICLLRRCGPMPSELYRLVCAGGAWKTHPLIFENFERTLHSYAPELPIRKPLFEPVCAGCLMRSAAQGMSEEAAIARLLQKMPGYAVRWPWNE